MTVGVDWLAFTSHTKTPREVVEMLAGYLGDGFETLPHGARGYERMAQGPGRATVYYSAGREDVHAELPGKACGALSEAQLRGLVLAAWSDGKVTRVDLYADDMARRVHPRKVYESAEAAVTHTNKWKWQIIENRAGGATCYIGAGSSRRRLRVYDKRAESGGANPSIRWEIQGRFPVSQTMSRQLATDPWGDVWAQHVVGLVDFRQRHSGRGDRGEREPWFTGLVGDASKAICVIPTPPRTVEDVKAWLRKQVAPSLAVGLSSVGGDIGYLERLAAEGRRRWTPKHRALLGVEAHEIDGLSVD